MRPSIESPLLRGVAYIMDGQAGPLDDTILDIGFSTGTADTTKLQHQRRQIHGAVRFRRRTTDRVSLGPRTLVRCLVVG